MSSLHNVLFIRIDVILLGSDRLAGGAKTTKFEKGVDRLGISSYCCGSKSLHDIIVDSFLDVFGVDSHNPLISWVVSTWILYPEDISPFYVVSLPSSLCFNVWTSL
jgi:hypothetical protein